MAGVGAAVGVAARHIIPTKQELPAIKNGCDEFISSAAMANRANNRSILKYGAIGALIAGGITMAAKALNKNKQNEYDDEFQYSKYQALLDASDYACLVTWWGD